MAKVMSNDGKYKLFIAGYIPAARSFERINSVNYGDVRVIEGILMKIDYIEKPYKYFTRKVSIHWVPVDDSAYYEKGGREVLRNWWNKITGWSL